MTKRELLEFLEPFTDDILVCVRLPNEGIVGIEEFQYEWLADEAIVVLSVRRSK